MEPAPSFRDWLVAELRTALGPPRAPGAPPPLLLFCDPDREWLDLLREAAGDAGLELWAPLPGEADSHELSLRHRLCQGALAPSPARPRVVWLPRERAAVTWLKVFELEATVWERGLLRALRDYGVVVPRESEGDLRPLLKGQARTWFTQPGSVWNELTPGQAKQTQIDEERLLAVLAGGPGEFARLAAEDRLAVFSARVVDDFGLPDPTGADEEAWRVEATARLLCTEAAQAHPQAPPSEGARIIAAGLARERALRLLRTWQSHIEHIPAFERLGPLGDEKLGLSFWARSLPSPPRSRASRAVEETLLGELVERLDRIEEVELLTQELVARQSEILGRADSFWARRAQHPVGWAALVPLADAAGLLAEARGVEAAFGSVEDAVNWYLAQGWKLEHAGERLFQESPDLPPQLYRVRARLRRGYARHFDSVGRRFSELLAQAPDALSSMATAGEQALAELTRGRTKVPTVLLFLDACRLDLGHRLAALLNEGEPADRARVLPAVAPVPSITALGMAFALPVQRGEIRVEIAEGRSERARFRVSAGVPGADLAVAEGRRRWLTERMKVQHFLRVRQVAGGEDIPPPGRNRLLVVHGDEFDQDGHEGRLQRKGADEPLSDYARALRRLRAAGYHRVIAVTDHGFFHFQPEPDEREEEKPEGELLWLSRRAMVGRDLRHRSAVQLRVPGSDLVTCVPRSVNAFRTYGGLGFFHGGATLQELIIPVVVALWPARAGRVGVVLRPVPPVTRLSPQVTLQAERQPGALVQDELGRRVLVRMRDPESGQLVFGHADPAVVPATGEPITVSLRLLERRPALSYGSRIVIEVRDAEDDGRLAEAETTLKIDVAEDDW